MQHTKICPVCKSTFTTRKIRQVFCSHHCVAKKYNVDKIKTPNTTCQTCNKPIKVKPHTLLKNTNNFCSKTCGGIFIREDPENALNTHTIKTETCWLWTGSKYKNGYGRIRSLKRGLLTHRVAWELTYGPIPDELQVCHKCDVRNCVRPDHLFLGTNDDNIRDMHSKNRHVYGARQHMAKLDDDKVRNIRELYEQGNISKKQLAERFGVSATSIDDVVKFKSWKHV